MKKRNLRSKSIKLKVLPSFFVLCGVILLCSKFNLFFCYVCVILFHESVHLVVARKYRYRCDCITLSAFGAVLYGDFEEAVGRQQMIIALSAPIANLFLSCIFVTLWYILPETYSFTITFALANVSIGIINLLPCYPLDGGKVLIGALSNKYSQIKALQFSKTCSIVISLCLFSIFVLGVVFEYNLYMVGLFAILLMSSALFVNVQSPFTKMPLLLYSNVRLRRGLEKRHLVFSRGTTVGEALLRLEANYLYVIEVIDERSNIVYRADCDLINSVFLYSKATDNLLFSLRSFGGEYISK